MLGGSKKQVFLKEETFSSTGRQRNSSILSYLGWLETILQSLQRQQPPSEFSAAVVTY